VLYAFQALEASQLTVGAGERLQLLSRANTDWWMARRVGPPALEGYIPAVYAEVVAEETLGFVFGRSTSELCRRDGGTMPQIVVDIIGRLAELQCEAKPGLFRWSGNHGTIAQICELYDQGVTGPAVVQLSSSAHDWCDVLQRWFRQLPDEWKLFPDLDSRQPGAAAVQAMVEAIGQQHVSQVLVVRPSCGLVDLTSWLETDNRLGVFGWWWQVHSGSTCA
jgi:hypothetical protein